MASTIIRSATLKLDYGAAEVDLSCYTLAFELTPSIEEVDVGTFCNPSAIVQGRVTYSAVASLLWEPALYTALSPQIGVTGVLKFVPDTTAPTQGVSFSTRVAAQPWGRFELGQRVEVDLNLAVLSTPLWGVLPALLPAEGEGEAEAATVAAAEPEA